MKVAHYSSSHKVIIRALDDPGRVKCDLTSDILTIHTSKAYGRGAGGWQITTTSRFADGKRWYDLQPNDLIEITMSSGELGAAPVVVMKGLIDRIGMSRVMTPEGQPMRTVKITGQDMGKLLLVGEVGWDISAAQMQVGGGRKMWVSYLRRYTLNGGSPAKLIKELVDIVSQDVKTLREHVECGEWITTEDDWHVFNREAYLLEQTPLWVAMKRFENPPWNILYCDTDDDGIFHIGLEEYPLDDNGLMNHDASATLFIDDADIVSEDIGISDAERVTLMALETPVTSFITQGASVDITLAMEGSTKFDKTKAAIERYGFIPFIFRTEFFPPSFKSRDDQGTNQAAIFGDVSDRANILWNWVQKNHTYRNGTITIHGRPDVRSGWKLVHRDTGTWFLIEQVSHEYALYPLPRFLTTLQVTRGQTPGASDGN